jgi:hypothetical protein
VPRPLTSHEKGAIAEAAVVTAALRAGIVVCRPLVAGRRYDLVFDFDGRRIERVQCKWGSLGDDVVVVRVGGCRHSPTRGYVRSTYRADELDALAVYCGQLDRCYYLPAAIVAGKAEVRLRLRPARNNQRSGVTMANDYVLGL